MFAGQSQEAGVKEQGGREEVCIDEAAAAENSLHTAGTSETQNAHPLHWMDRYVLGADAQLQASTGCWLVLRIHELTLTAGPRLGTLLWFQRKLQDRKIETSLLGMTIKYKMPC